MATLSRIPALGLDSVLMPMMDGDLVVSTCAFIECNGSQHVVNSMFRLDSTQWMHTGLKHCTASPW